MAVNRRAVACIESVHLPGLGGAGLAQPAFGAQLSAVMLSIQARAVLAAGPGRPAAAVMAAAARLVMAVSKRIVMQTPSRGCGRWWWSELTADECCDGSRW